jgi:uncharacterized membrane protein
MSNVPVQLIVAAFKEEDAADEALKALKAAKKEKLIGIKDAAVIRRDKKDKIHIKDVKDVGGGKGAVAGGLFGAAIALMTGGAGLVLSGAAGALVGGLTAKTLDTGLPNRRLKQLGEGLKPGTSAIVAIIEHRWVAELEAALAEAGAQVMTEALKEDIAQQLEAGHEVAYTAIATDEGVAARRVAGGEDRVEISGITMTEQGVSAQATLVTKEGAISKNILLTDAGLAASEVMVTEDGLTGEGVVVTKEGVVTARLVGVAAESQEGEAEANKDVEEKKEA